MLSIFWDPFSNISPNRLSGVASRINPAIPSWSPRVRSWSCREWTNDSAVQRPPHPNTWYTMSKCSGILNLLRAWDWDLYFQIILSGNTWYRVLGPVHIGLAQIRVTCPGPKFPFSVFCWPWWPLGPGAELWSRLGTPTGKAEKCRQERSSLEGSCGWL